VSKVYVVDLEAVETRYTGQWKDHVPRLLIGAGHDVQVISGPTDIPSATTPGAFLNFGGTNIYKSAQVEQIGRLFCAGSVSPGSHFIFTDAWHPGIINLKYMSELLGIPVKIHALWHAGSYDPQDFLGRLIGAAPWVRNAEKAFYEAADHNYFATQFHIDMFALNLYQAWGEREFWLDQQLLNKKIIRSGWPMEYMSHILLESSKRVKRNLILFPHRLAPEKQVEIFKDLATALPEYEFVVCQEQQLTKAEYHSMLGEAKIVFSANLQETLGISCYEALCVGAMPLVPDRLSYSEMYLADSKYPSEWTASWDSYQNHKQELVDLIRLTMQYHGSDSQRDVIARQQKHLEDNFFSAGKLLENLR
jgi:hypothetical protein